MSTCKRHGNKWTHNEVLSLHREYELLEWDIQKIADKHQRSVKSIINKLFTEEITPTLLVDSSIIVKRSCKSNNKAKMSEDVEEEVESDSGEIDVNVDSAEAQRILTDIKRARSRIEKKAKHLQEVYRQ
jgi:hypothetical protein